MDKSDFNPYAAPEAETVAEPGGQMFPRQSVFLVIVFGVFTPWTAGVAEQAAKMLLGGGG